MRLRLGRAPALAGLVVAIAGCNDPADFVRAKGAADFPSTSIAYRLFSVGSDCTSIGTVEHGPSIQAIAVTVANHGGTHYVITDERMVEEYVTSGQNLGGAAYAHQTSNLARRKQYTAEAYRCPPRQRGAQPPTAPTEAAPPAPAPAPAPPPPPDASDAGTD